MRYIVLLLIVLSFLIGTAGAVEGYEHKDFVNADGAHISYDINEYGWVVNGHFQAGSIILHFANVNGDDQTPYITDQGFKGWIVLKFCDDYFHEKFLVELIRPDTSTGGQEPYAEYWFNGNCDRDGNPE